MTGSFRATSLARFASRGRAKGPISVSVTPGSTTILDRAFFIKLNRGSSTDTQKNLGLAIRTGGGAPRNTKAAKKLAPGLYLLYGPSIHQAFRNLNEAGGAEDAAEYFEAEFLRQLAL